MSFRLDPVLAFRVLGAHDVRFVLIGGLAGNVWGSPAITQRMKRAADRPKDRIAVEILTAVKEERERS